jgi:hypothetical protein
VPSAVMLAGPVVAAHQLALAAHPAGRPDAHQQASFLARLFGFPELSWQAVVLNTPFRLSRITRQYASAHTGPKRPSLDDDIRIDNGGQYEQGLEGNPGTFIVNRDGGVVATRGRADLLNH